PQPSSRRWCSGLSNPRQQARRRRPIASSPARTSSDLLAEDLKMDTTTAKGSDFSDRDILIAILNGICALADRLGGGKLVIWLESGGTGQAVDVHGTAAGFRPGSPDSTPLQAALLGGAKRVR